MTTHVRLLLRLLHDNSKTNTGAENSDMRTFE